MRVMMSLKIWSFRQQMAFAAPLSREATQGRKGVQKTETTIVAFLSSKKDRSTKFTALSTQQQKKSLKGKKRSPNEYKLDGNTSERREWFAGQTFAWRHCLSRPWFSHC